MVTRNHGYLSERAEPGNWLIIDKQQTTYFSYQLQNDSVGIPEIYQLF